jgi:predicted metal-dependent hydrolase
MNQIILGNVNIKVLQKKIKHVHLSVYPPSGGVRISAPLHMNTDTIRLFAISKLHWIKKQQIKFHNQVREAPREYINRESHYFLGKRYLLKVFEHKAAPNVAIKHEAIELYIREKYAQEQKKRNSGRMVS